MISTQALMNAIGALGTVPYVGQVISSWPGREIFTVVSVQSLEDAAFEVAARDESGLFGFRMSMESSWGEGISTYVDEGPYPVTAAESVIYTKALPTEISLLAVEQYLEGKSIDGWNEIFDHDSPFGPIKRVSSVGGEGQGDQAYVIFQVGDRFFRKNGYYASWVGFEWDGAFEEVVPEETTVIRYVRA
jgi:hypothetical protein